MLFKTSPPFARISLIKRSFCLDGQLKNETFKKINLRPNLGAIWVSDGIRPVCESNTFISDVTKLTFRGAAILPLAVCAILARLRGGSGLKRVFISNWS